MKKTLIIVFIFLIIGLIGGLIFLKNFFGSFAPPKIEITGTEIKSNRKLINPITIQRIATIDSIAEETPIKYTVDYITTCSIKQEPNKPPVGLNKIYFFKPGRYSWSDEKVNIPIEYVERSVKRTDNNSSIIWSTGETRYEICPLIFERNKWYFIDFFEPTITGIFIYVSGTGEFKQYTKYSGVSPI